MVVECLSAKITTRYVLHREISQLPCIRVVTHMRFWMIQNIPNLDRITGAPGATLFVISTAPAFVGNMPEAANSRKLGEVVAMLGRVPVRVAGKAPNNSYLVPSGESDGLARAIPLSELQASANLRAQCFGVVWKRE